MKACLDQLFVLEPADRSAADSKQLRLPTLEERVQLYLSAVYGTRDFTNEEYSRARSRMLDAMAANVVARSGVHLGPQTIARGANPQPAVIPMSPAAASAVAPRMATQETNPLADLVQEKTRLAQARARKLTTRRISISIFAAAAAASVAFLLFVVPPFVWRPGDQNPSGSRLALAPMAPPVAAMAPPVAAADAEVSFVTRDLNTALPQARIAAVASLHDELARARDAASRVAPPVAAVAPVTPVTPTVVLAFAPVATVAPVAPAAPLLAAGAPVTPTVVGVARAAPVVPVARAPLAPVAPVSVSVRPNDITQAPPLLGWEVVRRGLRLLAQGQITDARRLLLHWEAQGAERDAAVALALGTSYDPIELEQLRSTIASPNIVPDLFADIAMARTWYQKAKNLGSMEAEWRLERLSRREDPAR